MDKQELIDNAQDLGSEIFGKKIKPTIAPQVEIGIDTDNELLTNIIGGIDSNQIDINSISSFTQVSRNRNELYDTLDYMSQDTTLASVLETYSEDATEMNESGDIVWAESSTPEITKFVTYLLNSLNVNKNVFKWTLSLCKYGDVYLRLYRESDYNDIFFNDVKVKDTLNEDIKIHAYGKNDKYVHYLEMADNPAQLFELTRFGKTAGYIKTDVKPASSATDNISSLTFLNKYKFNSGDVQLFPATEWVHGCLEDDTSRVTEEVELYSDTEEEKSLTYKVKRGQSLLYDSYKVWRELSLLENSVLLNRITQSSIVRVIGVEVGDMPKENVQAHLMNIKNLIEQRSALNVGKSMNEYTNPGPIINNVYIPTRNNQGVLSTQQIGGDVNIGELVDLNYYQDKLFGGLRVPKQYFGLTDDAAGFSGGTSLSIISSRYAKMIKRIQNVIIQMLTDAINLMLIDTGNESYINKFTLKMLPPTTQEEVDRRENLANKVSLVSDIMNVLTDVEDPILKLRILKSMLSTTLTDGEVVEILQEQIDKLVAETEDVSIDSGDAELSADASELDDQDIGGLFADYSAGNDFSLESNDLPPDDATDNSSEESTLPSPAELDIGDLSDSSNPNLS